MLSVLSPFEVADRDTSGIGKDIWKHQNVPFVELCVCFGVDRTVGSLNDQIGFDLIDIFGGDDIPKRRWNQELNVQSQKLIRIDPLGPLVTSEQTFVLQNIGEHLRNVEPLGIHIGTRDIADGHDRKGRFVQVLGRMGPDVPKALDGSAGQLGFSIESLEHLDRQGPDAPSGRFFTTAGTVLFNRFARDHSRIETMVLLPLIPKPGHDFVVGTHIGRRDVRVGPDNLMNLVDKRPGDPLKLPFRESARIDPYATFSSSIRKVHNGGFPCHQRSQRSDLVEVHRRMIPKPTFHRPARIVVLDSIPQNRFDFSIVSLKGDLDGHLSLRCDQQLACPIWKFQLIGCLIEI